MSKWDEVALTDEDLVNTDLAPDRWASVALEDEDAPTKLSEELDPERGSYEVDQWKLGVADFVDMLIPDQVALPLLGIDIRDYTKDGQLDHDGLTNAIAEAKNDAKKEYLGYQGLEPKNPWESLSGVGFRALGDPTSAVGSRGKNVGTLAFSTFAELLHSFSSGVIGSKSGEVAAELAEAFGLENEMVTEIIQTVGQSAGGAAVSGARMPLAYVASTAGSILTARKNVRETSDKASDYIASSQIRQNMIEAERADPGIADTIKAVTALEKEVPGLTIPPLATLADNPVYRKNIETLLRTRPEFYAKAQAAFSDSAKALDDYKKSQYGVGGAEGDALIRKTLPKEYGEKIAQSQKEMDALDIKLEKQAERLTTERDVESVGNAAQALMAAKEKAVQKNLSPRYEAAINKAENEGVKIAPRDAFNLNDSIQDLFQRGRFDDFPELAREVRNKWSQEYLSSPEVQQGGVPIRDLDSLKRAVNKAIRQTKDPDKQRTLTFLKDEVKILYETTGTFGEKIAALDLEFYEKLGIPRAKAGIKQLDAARFATQAGAYLAKPQQARDFLSFVGESGMAVLKDSVLIRANAASLRPDGSVNATGLAKFLRQNETLIDMVPGLKGEFQDIGSALNTLNATYSKVEMDHVKFAKKNTDSFYKAFENKDLGAVVDEMMNSPRKAVQYKEDIKTFTPDTQKMIQKAIRAEFVEKGINTPGSMVDFLKANKPTVDAWFGADYIPNLEKVGQISDILQKVDMSKMKFAIDFSKTDALQKQLGVSSVQLQSVLRDRISGLLTKFAILGSKMNTSASAEKRDNALMSLFLDPDGIRAIREAADKHQITFEATTPAAFKAIGEKVSMMMLKGQYFAQKEYEEYAPEPLAPAPSEEPPSLIPTPVPTGDPTLQGGL